MSSGLETAHVALMLFKGVLPRARRGLLTDLSGLGNLTGLFWTHDVGTRRWTSEAASGVAS